MGVRRPCVVGRYPHIARFKSKSHALNNVSMIEVSATPIPLAVWQMGAKTLRLLISRHFCQRIDHRAFGHIVSATLRHGGRQDVFDALEIGDLGAD